MTWAISFWVRAPQRMASRTRSAGESLRSMRAMRREEKPDLVSSVSCDLVAVAPCFAARALVLAQRFAAQGNLLTDATLTVEIQAVFTCPANSELREWKSSSHRGHRFNSGQWCFCCLRHLLRSDTQTINTNPTNHSDPISRQAACALVRSRPRPM